ncbi:AAA family ATPase [Nocardioides sp. NPDC057577]|uniref:AAA family ATPase n=1 Tax=Nocardioides sp. NPDC057577 TaxID=3346171 RepID=UPI00366DAAA1
MVEGPIPVRRVSVVGSSGSGKSTVARRLADILGVPYIELDAIHWRPGWVEEEPDVFVDRVREATRGDAWVIDGNYQSKVGTLVWEPAELVVWVNPPRWRVMVQVTLRTLRRAMRREELWNGNREGWGGLRLWSPSDSAIRWAWDSYGPQVKRYEAAMVDPRHSHLRFLRLRSRRDVGRFLECAAGVEDLDLEC